MSTLFAILSQEAAPLLLHCETPAAELLRYAREFGASRIITDGSREKDLQAISNSPGCAEVGSGYTLAWADVDTTHADYTDSFPSIGGVPLHPTSGTTGRPKIAVRHADAAIAEARQYAAGMEIDSQDSILCVVPMSHAYGYGTCMTLPILTSATVYTIRRFDPRRTARALAEHSVTTFFATPAMLDLLLVARGKDDPVPERVMSAGAPLSSRTGNRFHEATGRHVFPLYGTTETGGITVAWGQSEPCMESNVGTTLPGVEAEIRPGDQSDELEAGLGRVAIRSPSAMAGYLRPTGIDSSSVVDGWITTGDVGKTDERGCLHLVGRESEFINVFGMKVIPSEVEAVIAGYPDVSDVKVYAGKHRSGSDIVKACIAGPENLDIAALGRFCQEHLVHYKRPETIVRLDAVPRTPLGKIIREQLP